MTAQLEELLESGERVGLIVVAHPDDETIGAAGLMSRLHRCQLIHVTDGAPRDRRFWTGVEASTRADYARIRRSELARALSLAGIEPRCASGLGVVDQEASLVLSAIAQRLSDAMVALRPDFVVTHAYEGGHPDHDAIAFAVWAAGRLIAGHGGTPPRMFEMPLYHGAAGALTVGQFLPRPQGSPEIPEVTLRLGEEENRLKQAMLDCFQSQQEMLASFRALDSERFRAVPAYDFTQPPHPGPLLYEQRDFPLSGAQWREQAMKAMRVLDLMGGAAREGAAGRSGRVNGRSIEAARAGDAHDRAMAADEPGAGQSETPWTPGEAGQERSPEDLPGTDAPPRELPGTDAPPRHGAPGPERGEEAGAGVTRGEERPREEEHPEANSGEDRSGEARP